MFGWKPKISEITGSELQDELQSRATIFVVDVRTPGEFREGHIPEAHLMPLNELSQYFGDIPKDETVVTVCRSGTRSRMAASRLQKAGFEVKNLSGGMLKWKGPVG